MKYLHIKISIWLKMNKFNKNFKVSWAFSKPLRLFKSRVGRLRFLKDVPRSKLVALINIWVLLVWGWPNYAKVNGKNTPRLHRRWWKMMGSDEKMKMLTKKWCNRWYEMAWALKRHTKNNGGAKLNFFFLGNRGCQGRLRALHITLKEGTTKICYGH